MYQILSINDDKPTDYRQKIERRIYSLSNLNSGQFIFLLKFGSTQYFKISISIENIISSTNKRMRLIALVGGLFALAYSGAAELINQNLVRNGDFTQNFIGANGWVATNSLPGWQIPRQVQQGLGKIYNSKWGNSVVVELDSYQNDVLRQRFDLEDGTYILELNYAARSGFVKTSEMSISWNGQKVKIIKGEDDQIHSLRVPLSAVRGKNVLEIAGEGASDTYGMTIANVRLFRDQEASKIWEVRNNFKERYNLVKNGDFSQNFIGSGEWIITNSLPGWQVLRQVQQGYGRIYNNKWGGTVVVELDSNQNDVLRQEFELKSGQYALQLDYAARSGYVHTSQMGIFWNGQKVQAIKSQDDQIHTLRILLNAVGGKNTLEIAGEGTSDTHGMTIANVRLFPSYYQNPSDNLLSNGDFLKPRRFQGREWITSLPQWEVKKVQHGIGRLWSPKWGNRSVIELDQDPNNLLKQTISLSQGLYRFEVDYLFAQSPTHSSSFVVKLNGRQVEQIKEVNYEINQWGFDFIVTNQGQFTFEIGGKKSCTGLTIGRIQVIRTLNRKPTTCSNKNGS